jgi:hypothetical protein
LSFFFFLLCSVNPIYFVFFTTATIAASAIMYQGWHTSDAVNTVTMVCGFLIIFSGVYLLNSIAKQPPPTTTTAGTNAAPSVASLVPGTLSASFTVSRLSMMETTVDGTDLTNPTPNRHKYELTSDEEKKMTGMDIQQLQQHRHHHHHHLQKDIYCLHSHHHRQKQQSYIRQRQRANSLP